MSYPIPFGQSHHYEKEVDFRYLTLEEQKEALESGWSPPIGYLSATGMYGDFWQTCTALPVKVSAYSSQISILNTSQDGLANAKIFNGN